MSLADDIVEIQQLKAQYVWALDEGRIEDALDLFVDDLVFDTTAIFPNQSAWQGKDALRTAYETAVIPDPGFVHVVATPLITVDGDVATGRWRFFDAWGGWTERRSRVNHLHLNLIANYEDEYRRVDGRWRFSRVRVVGLPMEPVDEADVKRSGADVNATR